jgi:UDP-N-acetylglucosamine 2-epimerase (non-hydrolysing)
VENLRREWVPDERVHLVGNVMIDALRKAEPAADRSGILASLGLAPRAYGIVTLHRPENVDDPATLRELCQALGEASSRLPLVFPVHHRTRQAFAREHIQFPTTVRLIDPVGYVDMLALTKSAALALTDSGGLQEETTAFNVPCLTLREQTERPVTASVGTSEVVGHSRERILDAFGRVMDGKWKTGKMPELWDGKAAERIADILAGTTLET